MLCNQLKPIPMPGTEVQDQFWFQINFFKELDKSFVFLYQNLFEWKQISENPIQQ